MIISVEYCSFFCEKQVENRGLLPFLFSICRQEPVPAFGPFGGAHDFEGAKVVKYTA
jgi:hypothetical protein